MNDFTNTRQFYFNTAWRNVQRLLLRPFAVFKIVKLSLGETTILILIYSRMDYTSLWLCAHYPLFPCNFRSSLDATKSIPYFWHSLIITVSGSTLSLIGVHHQRGHWLRPQAWSHSSSGERPRDSNYESRTSCPPTDVASSLVHMKINRNIVYLYETITVNHHLMMSKDT